MESYARDLALSELRLDGEQLLIGERPSSKVSPTAPDLPETLVKEPSRTSQGSFGQTTTAAAPLSLSRKPPADDPPELPMPSHNSTLVLRIMPDDNSCLFRAFNSAYFGLMDNMHELRSIVAQRIQESPDVYSAVVLEKSPDEYCRWIQHPDSCR